MYPASTRNDLFQFDFLFPGRPDSFSVKRPNPRQYGSAKILIDAAVDLILEMPTTVVLPSGVHLKQPLGKVGPAIARALDTATTIGSASGQLFAGRPVVAIEIEEGDVVHATRSDEWRIAGVCLAARSTTFDGRPTNVFVLRKPRHAAPRDGRMLRVHLLRIHSERVYLRQLARLLAVDGFIDGCNVAQIDRIQDALNESLKTLVSAGSKGYSVEEFGVAFAADKTLSGAELEVLAERVRKFRPVIARRLDELGELERALHIPWRGFRDENPGHDGRFVYIREAKVSHYEIHPGSQIGAVGDNASASNFSFGNQINAVPEDSSDAEDLQAALGVLRKHLADLLTVGSVINVDSHEVTPTAIGSAIGSLTEADEAITDKDNERAEGALRRSGKWLMAFAQEVGVDIAAAAIRQALRLP
jgi:hypothetical protein